MRGALVGACWGIVLCGVHALAGLRLWGSPDSPSGLGTLDMVGFVVTILACVGGVVTIAVLGVISLMRRRLARWALVIASGVVALIGSVLVLVPLVARWHDGLVKSDLLRLETVIVAVERFEADEGGPPTELAALAPKYLPELPRIWSGELHRFRFERRSEIPDRLAWFEYSLGQDHTSVLRLWLDGRDSVVDARCLSLSDSMPPAPFDRRLWRESAGRRAAMARSAATHALGSVGRASLDSLLGPPSSTGGFDNPRWSLILERDLWGLGSEFYVFTPDGRTPEGVFTESSAQVGRWRFHSNSD